MTPVSRADSINDALDDRNASIDPQPVRWFHWLILGILLLIAAGARFHHLTADGLWPDEYWSSIYLATGRGDAIYNQPNATLLDPAPVVRLQGAPSWVHIWTGMRSVTHPPAYIIVLRWWMDLFGDSDYSVRTLSALFSLAGIVLLFDILRRTAGNHAGLLAAALMTLSTSQINYSQQARPYTMLALVGLLACHAIVRIEKSGATRGRLIQLFAAVVGIALTHYLAIGAIIGLGAYVLIRLHAADRQRAFSAILLAGFIALIAWGPFFWQQKPLFYIQDNWTRDLHENPIMRWARMLTVPYRLLMGRHDIDPTWIALDLIVYLFPLIFIRRSRHLLLWWCWVVGGIGGVAAYDITHGALLLNFQKYTFIATVGIYALVACPLPVKAWWRWLLPYAMIFATATGAVQRVREGNWDNNGDWRDLAFKVDALAGPREPLIFLNDPHWGPPAIFYLDIAHYLPESHRPIMMLPAPADARALSQLANYPRVWMIGPMYYPGLEKLLPGWKSVRKTGFSGTGSIVEMVPDGNESANQSEMVLPNPARKQSVTSR